MHTYVPFSRIYSKWPAKIMHLNNIEKIYMYLNLYNKNKWKLVLRGVLDFHVVLDDFGLIFTNNSNEVC